jgi:hypothetical protein
MNLEGLVAFGAPIQSGGKPRALQNLADIQRPDGGALIGNGDRRCYFAAGGEGMINRSYNRPGSRGHRNAGNSPRDKNDGGEVTSSGRKVRKTSATAKTQKRFPSRHRLERTGEKRRSGQDETRDSSREPSRGRSEFTGQMNKRMTNSGRNVRTGTSSTKND